MVANTGKILNPAAPDKNDGVEMRAGGQQCINALCPLSEMFGYATDLRSRTQGRGSFTMHFDHYEEVAKNLVDKILGIIYQ